jgi:Mycothiol maleylpyruvate isomerase N-terminal domain
MRDRTRLVEEEAVGAERFDATMARIPVERRTDATVTPDGWTPIHLAAHVAGWLDECSDVLERMTAGTWDPDEPTEDVDDINRAQVARAAALTWSDAQEAVAAARVRARAAWEALPEITPDAWSWYEESGPNHYAKHVHDLAAWLDGRRSDPDVGRLLQDDAEAWVTFASLVDAVADPDARDEDGWSIADVCHHVARWTHRGAGCVEHNAGFGPPWETDADVPTDEVNAAFLAESRSMSFAVARRELHDARGRLRAAFTALPEPSEGAKDVFVECTIDHYAEHLPKLRHLTGTEGSVA